MTRLCLNSLAQAGEGEENALCGVEVGFRGWDLELEVSTEPTPACRGALPLPTPKGVRGNRDSCRASGWALSRPSHLLIAVSPPKAMETSVSFTQCSRA